MDDAERRIVGVVAPYDETTYLVPDPGGERIMRGAFKRSIDHDRGAEGSPAAGQPQEPLRHG